MTRLGETIKAARLKAKMTPKALARKCGVSESFVNEVEQGRRILSDDQAQRMLKVLGVSNPVSTELEVASEPEFTPPPRPRPYVMPVREPSQPAPTREEQDDHAELSDSHRRRFNVQYSSGCSYLCGIADFALDKGSGRCERNGTSRHREG